MNYKLNKESLKKILFSDYVDEKKCVYLNINLLRHLKYFLLENMTQKERGCINLYHLENYLIERAFDPSTEYDFQDFDDFITNILNYLRTRPEYWIINTEIYLEIISKLDSYFNDDKYENKDLTAIYEYAYSNNIKKIDRKINKNDNENDISLNLNNYLNSPLLDLINHQDYLLFVQLLERESYLEIESSSKLLYDISLIPMIYRFILHKYKDQLHLHNSDVIKCKIQNFILFFSHISYDNDVESLWNSKLDTVNNNSINLLGKKYSLRLSRINEEELDKYFIDSQIKILEAQEKLHEFKKNPCIVQFLDFLRSNSWPLLICKYEKSTDSIANKNEIKLKFTLFSYILLNNLLQIFDNYIKYLLPNNCFTYSSEEELRNYRKLFEVFKNLKYIYKQSLDSSNVKFGTINNISANDFALFYNQIIEKNHNYNGCINLLKNYHEFHKKQKNNLNLNYSQSFNYEGCFMSSLTKEKMDNLECQYIYDYYEHDNTKNKRIYMMEHAGVNWTDYDVKKFEEGMKLFGHYQLANTKIAKFMGSHIQPSHVKLFRGQISKEKRINRRKEKISKISEMNKKNKNIKWKPVEKDIPINY